MATVEAADFENMLFRLRKQRQTWQEVDRCAELSDRITLNFTGEAEGENFTNGKVEGFQVEIGANKMVPGFEDNLVGLSVGDHKAFEVMFPDAYNNEKLAGKLAKFEVDVEKVDAALLPEIDAELVQAYGIDSGDIEEFKADVKANMERELKRALHEKLKTAVMNELYAKVPSSCLKHCNRMKFGN